MQVFKDDPIGIIRYMINMEMRENSREIAKLVHDEYFSSNKTYEEQIEQIEKVYRLLFMNFQLPRHLGRGLCNPNKIGL